MRLHLLMLILVSQVALVAGQIFLKHGMNKTNEVRKPRAAIAGNLAAGIVLLTVWFFLWLGLFQKLAISYVYPFEGLSPLLLVIGACLILKERLTVRAWMGVALIAAGTVVVGMS